MKSFKSITLSLAILLGCSSYGMYVSAASLQPKSRTTVSKSAKKSSKAPENTFKAPDFAYPQTVDKNAEAEYSRALTSGDGLNALRAAIQISIAKNSIDHENVADCLARFAELSDKLSAPWNSMASLLEAMLYSEVYRGNMWEFDHRKLPLTPYPANIMSWSGQQFAAKVMELVGNAVSEDASSPEIPLNDIAGILSDATDGIAAGMTVRDFIDYEGAQLLEKMGISNSEPLRFGDKTGALTPKEQCRELRDKLIDEAISRNETSGNEQLAALFSEQKLNRINYAPRYRDYLNKCYARYGDTKWGAPFVWNYCQKMINPDNGQTMTDEEKNTARSNALNILKTYDGKFPTAPGSEGIKNKIAELTSENVSYTVSSQILPGQPWKMVAQMSGIYDCKLLIYKVPVSVKGTWLSPGKVSELAAKVDIKMQGSTPAEVSDSISMPALDPGRYVIFASSDGTKQGIIKDSGTVSAPVFVVSGLSYFMTTDNGTKTRGIYVVNARQQAPVEGAKVVWTETTYQGTGQTKTLMTNKDGYAELPDRSGSLVITYGKDRISGDYYRGYYGDHNATPLLNGTLLTDLSIYKPGQKLQFAGVVYSRDGQSLKASPDQKLLATLNNANGQKVDTLNVTTDAYGRVKGEFLIPVTGLLGNYMLRLEQPGNNLIAYASVQVAEYKSPTFMVNVGKVADSYAPGDVLKIDGKAETYSGMPVVGANVEYTVKYMPWRFWWDGLDSQAECSGSASPDENGNFVIELPTANLKDSPYAHGRFSLSVRVTDAAGETQVAPAKMFALGSGYEISTEGNRTICVSENYDPITAKVSDITGVPVIKTLYYTIEDKRQRKIVGEGKFESPLLRVDLGQLVSGEYEITFSMDPEMKESNECRNAKTEVIIYRADDKNPPVETALWVPVSRIDLKAGQRSVEIPVGSSYSDSWVFAGIDNGEKVIESKWIQVSDGIVRIKVNAPEPMQRMFIHLSAMRDCRSSVATVQIIPAEQRERVEITSETFRDKLDPGAGEQWKFRFTEGGKPLGNRPVMSVMSNKALNALAPFQWRLNPWDMLNWSSVVNLSPVRLSTWNESFRKWPKIAGKTDRTMTFPDWNTYGYSLYGNSRIRGFAYATSAAPRMYKSKSAGTNGKTEESAADEVVSEMHLAEPVMMALNETEAVMADGGAGAGGVNQPNEELREIECPLAFFMPDLMTDSEGNVVVDFTVPQFNGTWQFQIAGYDSAMRGNVLTLDAVASKKVMVQMNAPRFLRTGDKASVSATMFNNTDGALPVGGGFDVTTPDGTVLASREYSSEEVPASGQRTVTLEFDVPSNISQLIVRAYARGGSHRDGEQTSVAVLPSSTPVIESQPFYTGPGEQVINVSVADSLDGENAPDASGTDKTVTLQYCGNPIWECVTALPDIIAPKSVNILAQSNALYGMAIANGLIKRYPRVAEALKTFAEPENASDSTLVSNLQKNQNIKIVGLDNTPWVNSAQDETRRMQGLIEYIDTRKAEDAIAAILKTLKDRQNNDGGWSWCPDMPSSQYITARVLLHFAMLKGMEYLPEEAEKMVPGAFRYVDDALVKDWENTKRKYFSTSELLNYLYVKSFFPSVKDTPKFSALRAKALAAIASEWKNFSIYDKATAVTLETRLKNGSLAGKILESIRQFASVSPEKGMWFANLQGVYSGWNPLITTAQVLEAYGEARPSDAAVDQLRQWLLMSKQTQNWGEMNGTAEVVQALLSTGSDWTVSSEPASVTIGGRELSIPQRSKLVDSFTITLTPEQTQAGDISIHKMSEGPAWGGVVSQYVAPILDVTDRSVPQLGITKNVYVLSGQGAETTELKVGDKVRVTLTLTCDRDMNYVAVMDGRSACLEPADQISGYTSSDGTWFYREVRNDATNLFIPYLSKGTHVISYECYVDRAGEYTLGIAGAQCLYAPTIAGHSAGMSVKVK